MRDFVADVVVLRRQVAGVYSRFKDSAVAISHTMFTLGFFLTPAVSTPRHLRRVTFDCLV